MSPSEPPLLQVDDLAVSYRTGSRWSPVLRQVSLTVARGEVVALIGESGSGKSTLANAVVGVLPANGRIDSGEVTFGERSLRAMRGRELRRVRATELGYVPQDPNASLHPLRTVRSQLREVVRSVRGRAPKAELDAEADRLLARAGIDDPARIAASYPHELSGGLLQRVLIAGALAGDPRLLIADEPTSALDATVQKGVLDTLGALTAEQGVAVLLVTHDLGLARGRADSVVVLDRNGVVEKGTVSTVLHRPVSPYTRRLLEDSPRPVAEVVATKRRLDDRTADVLGVDAVTKTYGSGRDRVVAADAVSFSVAPGTTHALVGESGSGKTTLARIVTGLVRPDSGSVSVGGRLVDVTDPASLREHRRELQLVQQNPFGSLDPRWTVQKIVEEPLRRYGFGDARERGDRVAELLDAVSLPSSVARSRPRRLSGGQRQRVAIARALALRPRLVVLDEPTSALDVTVQADILALLLDLQARHGLTYLFVSHDLRVVARLADTVTVLTHGRAVETGPVREVLGAPREDYTRTLLASST